LKVGHYFGGLDLADADVLRRMMSGKTRNKKHLEEIQEKYFTHCRNQNYPEVLSKEVWRQIESFAGYSFSKHIPLLTPWNRIRVCISKHITRWNSWSR